MTDRAVQNNVAWKKKIYHFALSGLVFFAVAMPCKYYFSLMEVTEIRPAAAFPPFFGMVYGLPGALGCAVANFIADRLSGYDLAMCVCSFPVQVLMGMLPYLLWYKIPVRGEEKPSFPKMDTTAHVVKYTLIILADVLVISLLLGVLMRLFGIAAVFSQITFFMFWNNFDFSYVNGVLLFTLIAVRQGRRFTMNERLILIFLTLSVFVAFLVGIATFSNLSPAFYGRIERWSRVYADVAVTLNAFVLVEILFLAYMEKKITIPIEKLASLANDYVQIGKGKLNSRKFVEACEPYTADNMEIGYLARSYVRMVKDLDTYMEHLTLVTAEKERIGTELYFAAKIQEDMLPGTFPAFPDRTEFDIFALMNPAKEVGGDFYDFFMVDARHLAVVVADVSGKGIPAALFMVIGKTLIKDHTQPGKDLGDVFTEVNDLLCGANREGLFITAFEGVLDLASGELRFVNAGHEPPFICKKGGRYEMHRLPSAFVLGGMEGMRYKCGSMQLEAGDRLYQYTDGVVEALNKDDELYGMERLAAVLNRNAGLAPEKLLPAIKEDIDRFADGAAQFDDITMLCLEYRHRMEEQ